MKRADPPDASRREGGAAPVAATGPACTGADSGCRARGFTLVELVIVVSIVGILAAAALPLARWSVKRSDEHRLRENLRILRTAIDRYHDAASAGLIEVSEGASGYPPSLDVLVEGVPLVQPMPSPAPPAAGEYDASGPGLTGGLQAMARAQQQAQGGVGGGLPGVGAGGGAGAPGTGAGPSGTAFGSLTGQRGSGLGGSGRSSFGGSGRSSLFGNRGGSSFGGRQSGSGSGFGGGFGSQLDRGSSFFDSRGSRPSAGTSPFDADRDAFEDQEGALPSEPLVGPDGQPLKVVFLRRLPVDPMTGEADWGLRCYGDPPEDRLWCGTDVFDVYSKSIGRAIDGTSYRDW